MISYQEAYKQVLQLAISPGTEQLPLEESLGRVLAEDVLADRDFPPFDRATKDGIAIKFSTVEKGRESFEIEGIAAAGVPALSLRDETHCLEIMTGAVLPAETDTVVMYEDLEVSQGMARLLKRPLKGQNIHRQGSDNRQGTVLLHKNFPLSPGGIGVLAAVGKMKVLVKKLPKVAVISTGDELVPIETTPLMHQQRMSNAHTLSAALAAERISPALLHVTDEVNRIREVLSYAIQQKDVLLISGGVSRGKFDFIPQVLEESGIEKIFHNVLQRPGKPFWFGAGHNTIVFSFPGNPVSAFACFYAYFIPWLRSSLGLPMPEINVLLGEEMKVTGRLTRFIGAKIVRKEACLYAHPVEENGSGDLCSLSEIDGFLCLQPREKPYEIQSCVSFIPTDTRRG